MNENFNEDTQLGPLYKIRYHYETFFNIFHTYWKYCDVIFGLRQFKENLTDREIRSCGLRSNKYCLKWHEEI